MKLPWYILGASIASKTTKTALRNHKRPLRLQGWRSGESRCWTTFQECRDLKMNIQLPWFILGTFIMSKSPKIPVGTTGVILHSMMILWRHIEDGALPGKVKMWKLICSFHDVSVGHPVCKVQPLRNQQHPHKLLDDALEGEGERSENVKKGKKWKTWKREKELHSQAHSVTLIQNVHNFTQLDTSGYKWTPVDTNGNMTNNWQ